MVIKKTFVKAPNFNKVFSIRLFLQSNLEVASPANFDKV